jgi:hypothetical protein
VDTKKYMRSKMGSTAVSNIIAFFFKKPVTFSILGYLPIS